MKFNINDELENELGELKSVSFSRARKRRESAAIFNRLNEDTCINLLNDPLELTQTFEEDAFEFYLPKVTTPEMETINDTNTPCVKKMDSIMSLRLSQNNDMNASLDFSREASLNTNDEYQQNAQAMNNTLINQTKRINTTPQNQSDQDLTSSGNINDESLLIEQRARTTLRQFKEMMSKFKTLNVDAQPPPVKSASKSELKANVSHIKHPDDVVRLVNHLLYSPIGMHRTRPVQEKKIREQHGMDVNNDNPPLKKYTTKEFTQSRLFSRYKNQDSLIQKDEVVNQADFQQSMSLGDLPEGTTNKGKILKYENKLCSLTHSRKSVDNSNSKGVISQASYRSTPMIDLSNNGKQRNSSELSTENLELRKRKRTAVAKSLSPHPSSINNSNKIQAKLDISPAAKKTKIRPSNLRAPTSVSRLKYNANQKRVNSDGFKTLVNSQIRLSHQTKQRK